MCIFIKKKGLAIIITTLILCSCQNNPKLTYALECAQENRGELEKVLDYYKDEPEKQKAALFLIKNMPFHFSQEEYYYSPLKGKYIPDVTLFANKNAVQKHCDSLLKKEYQLIRQKRFDIKYINSEYIINNIELAFSVLHKPWNKNISFEDFCQYILPYRVQNECPSSLRKEMRDKYLPLLDSIQPQNPLEACSIIHQELKKIIAYKTTGCPLYPTTEETFRTGLGDCNGLCNLTTIVMRAVGIPVTIDHTLWTKMNMGHSWCVVLSDRVFYCFNPGETAPGEETNNHFKRYHGIPAKVYRDRFEPNFNTLINPDINDNYITHLKNVLKQDVTHQYFAPTIQLVTPVEQVFKNPSPLVYLCTFNSNQWQPLAIGERKKGNYIFENVVGDNIFIIADSPDGSSLRFVSSPFYVDENGNIRKLVPNKEKTFRYVFPKKKFYLWGKYHLYYWDTDTQSFTATQLVEKDEEAWTYEGIPENGLLLFYIPTNNRNRHFFFIEKNEIKPWKEEMGENC